MIKRLIKKLLEVIRHPHLLAAHLSPLSKDPIQIRS